jgi:hypothetical protein
MLPRIYPDLARAHIAEMEQAAQPRPARRRQARRISGVRAWHWLSEFLASARLRRLFGPRGLGCQTPACSTPYRSRAS